MSLTLTYAELDVPYCTRTYGVAPCSAQLGVTGSQKCFNSPATCQAHGDYQNTIKTLRWVQNAEYVPFAKVEAVPSLQSAETSPQKIEPGESLGKRERVKCGFKNHPHNDIGLDPYVSDRDYNPWDRGTYWGRFNARYPNIAGYPFRILRGDYDPAANLSGAAILQRLETSHYIADKLQLSAQDAVINGLDVLTFIEGNKSLCPRPSNGVLAVDITDVGISLTLLPAGIGSEYPASGEASIGKEYVTFNRSGDNITLTGRALYGSERKAHEAGVTFQLAAVITGNIAAVLNQLLQYTDTPATWYDVPAWETEATEHAFEILHARIAVPTEVSKLVGHLMTEMGLDIHSDCTRRKIFMRVLRPLTPSFYVTEDSAINLSPDLDSSTLYTAVYLQYGRINPLESIDEDQNYLGHLLRVSDDPELILQNNSPAIHKVQSIWLPGTQRQVAGETAALILGRYSRVLRTMQAVVRVDDAPQLGDVGEVTSRFFEDATGSTQPIPMQVVQITKGIEQNQLLMQEYTANYIRPNDGTRRVPILPEQYNADLRVLHDLTFGSHIPPGTPIIFEADPNVVVGSKRFSDFALRVGDWPEVIAGQATLLVTGLMVVGMGGRGGMSKASPNGLNGGPALYSRVPITFENCEIGGGGGGGGGSLYSHWSPYPGSSYETFYPGGGGAGRLIGGGKPPGTLRTGGVDNTAGGAGGDLGQPGKTTLGGPLQHFSPGQAGIAIDGKSFVTLTNTIVHGLEIN